MTPTPDPGTRPRVLIVDDEPGVRFGVRARLEAEGYEVGEAADCASVAETLERLAPEIAIVDYELPDGDALTVLERARQRLPDLAVIVLTGHGTIERAVQAVKAGAEEFLEKPIEMETLAALIRRMLEQRRALRLRRDQAATGRFALDPFLGHSAIIRRLAADAARVARTDSPVLIIGPTGSGKGVLASWLHRNGPRADAPFVDLNCAGFSREFLETELFGHRKGAFTGAVSDKPGLLEIADGGSVFLDEIGDLDLALQPKLLKALEDRRFRRLGEVTDRVVDVRMIAATNMDLAARAESGQFRNDLYFRLSTFVLRVPGLSERRDDIPLIATHITADLARELRRDGVGLKPEAMELLRGHRWDGNLRELRNVLERSIHLTDASELGPEDLRFEHVPRAPGMTAPPGVGSGREETAPRGQTLDEVERETILRAYREENGRVDAVARRLAIPRSTLYDKLRRYGITLRR